MKISGLELSILGLVFTFLSFIPAVGYFFLVVALCLAIPGSVLLSVAAFRNKHKECK